MLTNNVPNKETKENNVGNMMVEQEIDSANTENNLNQENIQNTGYNQIHNEFGKKTNHISTKSKKLKNYHKQIFEVNNSMNTKTKNASTLKNSCKETKLKNSKGFDKNKKLSKNEKIDQSNSSLNNQQKENEESINDAINQIQNQKNFEGNGINEMNIENQENNANIINQNLPNNQANLVDTNIGNIKNIEDKENLKPVLTWKTINDSNSSFIPMEYMNEIWESFIEKEYFNIYSYDSILEKQTDIKEQMRCILIDWLISLQNKFFKNIKTLFLTVNLIDRYLSQKQIFRTHFQLLGVTALFIACKYEEMYMNNINDFVDITAKAFDKYEILKMESELIDLVDFNLDLPLSLDFFGLLGSMYKFNKKEFKLGYFLLEAYLLSLNCCKYKQRQIGLAVCYIILGLRRMQDINLNSENNFVKYYSDFFKININIWNEGNSIIECAKNIFMFYEKSGEVKYREVYNLFYDLFI